MNKRNLLILGSFFLLFLAAGCTPECTAEEIASFHPILLSPPNGSVVEYDSPPTFQWTEEETCVPSQYDITFLKDGVSYEHFRIDGDLTNFNRSNPLQPGTSYEWYVEAVHAYDLEGGYGFIYGPPSAVWSFTTDGFCSSASELNQPILVEPQFGEWVNSSPGPGPASINIEWSYSGPCLPDSFHYQAASDPEFTNIITTGTTEWNVHSVKLQVPKCARIYWRVQARVGNDSGEYSEPSRFTFSSIPSCFQNQASIDAVLIKGYVFDDYCKSTVPYVPEGVDIWPPCTVDEFGVHANGARARAPGENETTGEEFPAETGISGVVVDLGSGPCPSTGLDQFTTSNNGNYYFMVQSPGEYCVSIDKTKNPKLDHGIWTLPLTDQEITEATIVFNPGDEIIFQNFGWDQNDFLIMNFHVAVNSFCRAGDSKEHLAVVEVPADTVIPIFARNEDATWFAAFVNGRRCFISVASGTPEGDPDGLLLYPIQPTPIPIEPEAELKQCSDYKTEDACMRNSCEWVQSTFGSGHCIKP